MTDKPESLKAGLAKFLGNPTHEALQEFLKNHLGEHNDCDFKRGFPAFPKLARHLLALGNYGSGCLIIGVDENSNQPEGLGRFTDKSEIIRQGAANDNKSPN